MNSNEVNYRKLTEAEKATIPTEGVILIRPYPNLIAAREQDKNKTWGYTKRSGWFSINKIPIEGWNYMGQTLGIHGLGTMLDMANPDHRQLFAIYSLSDQFKGVISESKSKKYGPTSRFYFQNDELEAVKYLAGLEAKNNLVDMIRSSSAIELDRIAVFIKVAGSETLKKATLLKMTETEDGRKKLAEILLSPDRELLELIVVAETHGNITKKEGLYVNKQTGVYYWNDISIGLGRATVVAHLKSNIELQSAMKQLYWVAAEPKAAAVVEKPKEVIKINSSEGVITKVKEEKYSGKPTDQQIIDAFNGGDTDPGSIGRTFNVHHFTVRKVLKAHKLIE